MPFDISAGLSQAGGAVAATAGTMVLESQKADLEMEKVKLADQLAGARQDKQNVFTTSERLGTEAHASGEKALDRSSALDIANLQSKTAITTAGIGAGATMGAAQLASQTSKENLAATLAQNKPLIDVEVLGKQIANTNATQLAAAKDDLVKARETNDPDKIRAAIQKEADLSLGADKNIQIVAQYQAAQKMAQTMYAELNGKIATLTASPMASTPEVKAQIDLFTKAAEQARREYESARQLSQQAQAQLPVGMPPAGGPAAGTKPPLSQLITGAPGPAVPPASTPQPGGFLGPGGVP